MVFRSLRLGWPVYVITLFTLVGCSGGDGGSDPTDPGPTPTPTIAITLSPGSLTLDQGGSGTVTVNVTRGGGYTGAVTATVQGAPGGVTASPVTIASGSNSGSVTVEASASAAPGTSTVTVRATGTGVSDATATFSLTINAVVTGGFSVSLNPASVSVQQGQAATTTATVTRTGDFTGTVALAASGQPSGLTVGFDPADVTGDASTVTVSAASGLATGSYSVTVTGSAMGLPDATATLTVEVTAPPSGQGVTLTYCDASGIPTWLAVKDGDGPWVPVTPTMPAFGGPSRAAAEATYQFEITSDEAGLATVTESGGSAELSIFYASRDEIGFQGDDHCPGTGITKSASGTVAGVGAMDQAYISVGGASTSVLGAAGNPNFTITGIPDGTVDLIASLVTLDLGGGGFTSVPQKVIIRRNLNPPDNTVFPVLDFGSGEAFDPVSLNLTISNLGTDAAVVTNLYRTANGGTSLFFSDFQPLPDATRTFPGVPAAQQAQGDFHVLSVLAFDPNLPTLGSQRSATVVFNQAADQTVAIGPDLNMPTITWPSVTPYVLFRAQLPRQDEYDQYQFVSFAQTAGRQNSVTIGATAAYLGGMDMDETVPDFSGLAGFNTDWGPEPGVATTWNVFGVGWTGLGGVTGNPFSDGVVSLWAARSGEITP